MALRARVLHRRDPDDPSRRIGPGAPKALVAENPLIKQQLNIFTRYRQLAPNRPPLDRLLLGFLSLFLPPRRFVQVALTYLPLGHSKDSLWSVDLFRGYYNLERMHSGIGGAAPDESAGTRPPTRAELRNHGWERLCRGLCQHPAAA